MVENGSFIFKLGVLIYSLGCEERNGGRNVKVQISFIPSKHNIRENIRFKKLKFPESHLAREDLHASIITDKTTIYFE